MISGVPISLISYQKQADKISVKSIIHFQEMKNTFNKFSLVMSVNRGDVIY